MPPLVQSGEESVEETSPAKPTPVCPEVRRFQPTRKQPHWMADYVPFPLH